MSLRLIACVACGDKGFMVRHDIVNGKAQKVARVVDCPVCLGLGMRLDSPDEDEQRVIAGIERTTGSAS